MSSFSERARRGPASIPKEPADESREIVPLEVITLMHGGGPVAGEADHKQSPTRKPDPLTPIRGTAVRGQLRFWWRATHGCTKGTLAEMRKAEDELWGNASKPGKVDLVLTQRSATENVEVAKLVGPGGRPEGIGQGLRYGAFASGNLTKIPGQATLVLRVDKEAHLDEVRDALHAWLLLGGIGGRTRRGFGAVSSSAVTESAESFVARFATKNTLNLVPTLHGATLKLGRASHATAGEAHRAAVDALRHFRQQPGFARNQGVGHRPGRSRWPEPDTLRRIGKNHSAGHSPQHPVSAFPRAAFGMPIVFHFKDREDPGGTLCPKPGEGRMASPILLRPVRDGNRWKAMALRLRVPGLEPKLQTVYVGKEPVSGMLRNDEHLAIDPLRHHADGADVLAAFLHFFTTL